MLQKDTSGHKEQESMEIDANNIAPEPKESERKRKREEDKKKINNGSKSSPTKILRVAKPSPDNSYKQQDTTLKERLYSQLSKLQTYQDLEKNNTWASSEGIFDCLSRVFRDEAHIIHPELSSIHSPAEVKDNSGAVNYVEAIEEKIKADGGELKKPIIAIWNTDSIRQEEGKINANAEGGSHWQTLVILPKNHKIHNGQSLNNENELVFFKDSYYQGRSVPVLLKILFKEKVSFKRDLKEGEKVENSNIELGGMLANAKIYDEAYNKICQQEEGYDCGWWAVYNAFMFVMEGGDKFLAQFKSPSRELGYKLRKIFLEENFDLAKQTSPKEIQKDWYTAFETAFKTTLFEQLKQKDHKAYESLSNSIEKLNLYYLSILSLIAEEGKLEKAYYTAEEIRKEEEKAEESKGELPKDILNGRGLKNSLHGNLYQWSLLTWVALQADSSKQFRLMTEAKEFEKFDDLVLKYPNKVIFLQAKHSSNEAGKDDYKKSSFTSSNYKGEASLAKYFDSWYRLEKSPHKKQKSHYVFCTNRGIKDWASFLVEDHAIGIPELELGGRTLRFKNEECRNEFINSIRANSYEVKNYKGEITPCFEKTVIEKAKNYLTEKFQEFIKPDKTNDKKDKSILTIDGRSRLHKKTLAVIKLAQENDEVFNKLGISSENIKEYKEWLRAKDAEGKYKIKVSIGNPQEALSDKLGEEINEFLDQLILKVEQPNFKEMSKKISTEPTISMPIAAAEFCANIGLKILNWFADPKSCDISSTEVKKVIDSAKGDALRFYLLANNDKWQALEGCGLPDHIKQLLKPKERHSIIRIEKSPGIELRIAQTIKDLGIKEDNYAFLSAASNHLEYVSSILRGEQMQIAVFDYSDIQDESFSLVKNELGNILESAKQNHKKIILLTSRNDDRFKQYGEVTSIENSLSDEQIQSAIRTNLSKKVNIAGKKYELSDLIANKNNGVYQAMKRPDFLYAILNQDKEIIDELELGLPYNIYIENQLKQGEALYPWPGILSQVQAGLFIITGLDANKVKKELANKPFNERTVFDNEVANEKTKYRLISTQKVLREFKKETGVSHIYIGQDISEDIKSAYSNSYIIFKVDNNQAIIDKYNDVTLPIAEKYQFSQDISRSDVNDGNFCIVSANAGRGKSSFCLHKREQWVKEKTKEQYSWVIRIDLSRLKFKGLEPTETELFNKQTTDVVWHDWQLEALKHDMKRENMVTLLLDGFDEIKDPTVIQKLGTWLTSLDKETKLWITTRPYAAHNIPMPNNRNMDYFLTLNEYTKKEKNDYIEKYIKAATKDDKSDAVQKVIEEYQNLITKSPENIRATLGVPLESYLFCAGFEQNFINDHKNSVEGKKTSTKENVSLSSIDVFERFLRVKLLIFLRKHLHVESDLELKQEHILYTTTSLYMDILQVFAFRQTFSLDYAIINNALLDRYFDNEVIQDLNDTGLLLVEKQGQEYYLKFNNATYQEYFSALKIISGLLSSNQDVEQIFKQYKQYMPSYQVIFQFAAQTSISGSSFLSRVDQRQDLSAQKFWGALFGDVSGSSDMLGVAENALIQRCLQVLLKEELKILEKNTNGTSWHQKLMTFIQSYKKEAEKKNDDVQDPPVERVQNETEKIEFDKSEVMKRITSFCDDKNSLNALETYINNFNKVEQNQIRAILAAELTSRKEWDERYNYWAVDFGIPAVGFCGKYFTKELADKLKSRSYEWKDNFSSSLETLSLIYNSISRSRWAENKHGIKETIFDALSKLLESNYANSFSVFSFWNIKQISKSFLEYISEEDEFLIFFKKALLISEKVGYAVVLDSDIKSLQFIGEDTLSISYNDSLIERMFLVLKNIQHNNLKDFIVEIKRNEELVKLERQYNLKVKLLKLDKNGQIKLFQTEFYEYSKNKNIEKLKVFFNDLKEISFNDINLAKEVLANNFFAAKHEANRYWSEDFGCEAIAYCGYYITDKILNSCNQNRTKQQFTQACSSLANELINDARDIVGTIDELEKIRAALEKIKKIMSQQIDKELYESIQQTNDYISSIEGHIKNGCTIEQAKFLFEMGIKGPIMVSKLIHTEKLQREREQKKDQVISK